METRASIDIGSNSTLLLIGEVEQTNLKIIRNESNITALGRELDQTGQFHEQSMKDTYQVLSEYKKIAATYNIPAKDIIITATEASRVAKNAKDFFKKIQTELGLTVSIITGEGEAFYSINGVLLDKNIKDDQIVLMDIGGASTEFIMYDRNQKLILKSISTPVGVVRATEWMKEHDLIQTLDQKLTSFQEKLQEFKTDHLVCVAGTMTSIGNMKLGNRTYDEKQISGQVLSSDQIIKMQDEYQDYSQDQFLEKYPFLGKRSYTIKAGLKIVNYFSRSLGVKTLSISTYGLRHGTIISGQIEKKFLAYG